MARKVFGDIWRESRGATAIEYGVVVAGVAVSIAAAVFVLGGNTGVLFGKAGDLISGRESPDGDTGEMRVILNQTFETDREGWSGIAQRRTLAKIGTGLSLANESRIGDGREAVSRTFDIPKGATRAELSFDMSFVDSWDVGEQAKVYVNGTPVIVGAHNWRSTNAPSLVNTPTAGMTIDARLTNSVQAGSWSNGLSGTDHTYRVIIAVDNPGEKLQLGFGTTLDQAQADESLLIGQVELRANR